jgi:uncharacterized protein YprB with RNaseH-like and TPR domain
MTKHDDAEALRKTAHLSGYEGYTYYVTLGGTRSFDGWEVKRRRLGIAIDKVAVSRSDDGYVGLNIGYFDIETTFSTQPIMLYGAIADAWGNVTQFRRGEDITDDKELVIAYRDALEQYDVLVSWNGKLFDVPVLNGRLGYHQVPFLRAHMHIDLMYYATGQFMRMGRKSLQSVSEFSNQKTPMKVRQWDGAMSGKPEEYEKIVEHCDADVLVLRDVFPHLKRHVRTVHRAG